MIDLNQLKKIEKTKINNKLKFLRKFSFSLKKLELFQSQTLWNFTEFYLEIFLNCSANYAVVKKIWVDEKKFYTKYRKSTDKSLKKHRMPTCDPI